MKAIKELITIDGKDHLMTFGIRFLELMGKEYSKDVSGLSLRGLHYASILTELQSANPVIVYHMIRFSTEGNRYLTDEAIEEYVFEQIEDEETEKALFDRFFDIFKKLPGAKKYVKDLDTSAQAVPPSEEAEKPSKVTKSK